MTVWKCMTFHIFVIHQWTVKLKYEHIIPNQIKIPIKTRACE